MSKRRKKIDKAHLNRFNQRMLKETPELMKKFDILVKKNGWSSKEARIFAFMTDYVNYNEGKPLEFEGD